jgi:transposase
MTLQGRLLQLENENKQLREQLDTALAQIAQLQAQLALNSHNFSRPPSSDSFKRSPKSSTNTSKKSGSGRKSGGQSGHAAATLEYNQNPSRYVRHLPPYCAQCQHDLTTVPVATGYLRRQVIDLPVGLSLETVEHQSFAKTCPACHTATQAPFPPEVRGWVQYGPRLRALAVYLSQVQLLPYARTCEVLNELFGVELSEGSLYSMLQQCYERLEPVEQVIIHNLLTAPVAHNDETGMYVEGLRQWLHVMSTLHFTFYGFHRARGKRATDDLGVLPLYKGISVHDGWASYFANLECQHALCNAHHLRELTFVASELGQLWAQRMIQLLLALKAEVAKLRADGENGLSGEYLAGWQAQYQELIRQAYLANPPPQGGWSRKGRGRPKKSKARNLVERMDERRVQVLAFATNFDVPFDNNQAERDLRMVKVQQKISSCFRSKRGATFFCRIRSYISTLRKQGQSAFRALVAVFEGQPLMPRPTT